MRWFFRTGVPRIERMLLIESGPRDAAEQLIPKLRESVCGDAPIDLFACVPGEPEGLAGGARAWRSYHATGLSERWAMQRDVREARHDAAAILCVGSPLLASWKAVLAALLPAKILLVDESGRLIWLDRSNWIPALRLAVARSGLASPELFRKIAHVLLFPFGLCLLLAFAAKTHLARILRAMGPAGRSETPSK